MLGFECMCVFLTKREEKKCDNTERTNMRQLKDTRFVYFQLDVLLDREPAFRGDSFACCCTGCN